VDNAAVQAIGARLAEGDQAALEECYRQLGPLVLSYLRRYVSRDEAEDVLQKVFVEVWRSQDRYDPGQSLTAWVLGIARKRAIDQLRTRRKEVVPLDEIRELSGDDGRETAERFAWAMDVRRALTELPVAQQEVLRLAYFGEFTQTEIAARLDVPLGTVKTRMSRGMQRLAGLLEQKGGAR
jgi:RNA polymerase sigma-70 factor (ECF subfamily)